MKRSVKYIGIILLVLIFGFILYTCAGRRADNVPAADADGAGITEEAEQSDSGDAEPIPEPALTPSKDEEQEAQADKEPEGKDPSSEVPVPEEEKPVEQPEPEAPEASSRPEEPAESEPPPETTEKPEKEEKPPTHTHSYEAVDMPATCEQRGYTVHTCSCGDSYVDQFQQPTGHDWGDWVTTKAPTYTEEGEWVRTCRVCGATKTRIVDKLEYEDPATCEHEWKRKYHAEVGHYSEPYVVCKCGFRCSSQAEWIVHVENNLAEAVDKHTSWSTGKDYIVDTPAYYDWHCTKCGTVTDVEP